MNKIKFIANERSAEDTFPPVPIKKVIPDWYKNLGRYQLDKKLSYDARFLIDNDYPTVPQTAKGCIPMRDYLMSGYVIRAQADVLVKQEGGDLITGCTRWAWFSRNQSLLSMNYHNFDQLPVPLNGKKNSYIKFKTPWGIQTPKGYSCLLYQPELFFETRFKLFPAIVDTDTYNFTVEFPGLITTADESFLIEAGTPLIAVFPFKREGWKMETSYNEQSSFASSMFLNWYKKLFHSRKSYN